jgi:hypothetical protein
MRHIISLVALVLLSLAGHAQIMLEPSVLASGGNYAETESMSISWTLGELATTTLTGGDMILTQGFQQPSDFGTGINTEELNWGITAYPNPVATTLYVKFDIDMAREF